MIRIKSPDEIAKMRLAGRIAALALEACIEGVRSGITTEDLDKIAEEVILAEDGRPVFKGYRGFKHASCISINEEIVHGIPGARLINEGDLVSIDVGAEYDGYCGDNAATVAVGKVSKKAQKLVRITREALRAGIKQARPGNRLGDMSFAIQKTAEKAGFSVVRELYGHGIGKELHEDPLIPNFGKPQEGVLLKPGMVLAIEPMLNIGTWKIKTLDDGWTVVTEDKSLSAHFEDTILITDGEAEILTK